MKPRKMDVTQPADPYYSFLSPFRALSCIAGQQLCKIDDVHLLTATARHFRYECENSQQKIGGHEGVPCYKYTVACRTESYRRWLAAAAGL